MSLIIFSLLIIIILSLLYFLSYILSLSIKDFEKTSAYECGFTPTQKNIQIKFDIIYWIIGILYLIFDLELIFIFPLTNIIYDLNSFSSIIVYLIFIIILSIGFIYEWNKDALKLS